MRFFNARQMTRKLICGSVLHDQELCLTSVFACHYLELLASIFVDIVHVSLSIV